MCVCIHKFPKMYSFWVPWPTKSLHQTRWNTLPSLVQHALHWTHCHVVSKNPLWLWGWSPPWILHCVRGATTFLKLGVQFLGLGYCTKQNTDIVPSFVHCSLLRRPNGSHTFHQKSWGGPSKFWGGAPDPPSCCALALYHTAVLMTEPLWGGVACYVWYSETGHKAPCYKSPYCWTNKKASIHWQDSARR